MGGDDGFYFAVDFPGGDPFAGAASLAGPDDPALAWDAAERYAVKLVWQALPEVRSVAAPADELVPAAERIKSRIRKWPYKQLARAAWGRARPRGGLAADDAELWLDMAGAMAATRHYRDIDSPLLAPVSVLRPADWAGVVIGVVGSGVNAVIAAEDMVRHARQCPQIEGARDGDDGDHAYDPFASDEPDDECLRRAFEAVLLAWEAVGAVSEQFWLTGLGWWGLPRALARAWNGDFDAAGWIDATESEAREGNWPGREASPADLGIRLPPLGF